MAAALWLLSTAAVRAQVSRVERASVSSVGSEANGSNGDAVVSADGRYVVFSALFTNLVPGRLFATLPTVLVRDRWSYRTEYIGEGVAPAISADGRFVAYENRATNQISLRDRAFGTTETISLSTAGTPGNAGSLAPSLSADGRYVLFTSTSTDLVPGDTNASADVFVRDRSTGTTTRLGLSASEAQGNGPSRGVGINGDGRWVLFVSSATNLVPGDTNGVQDVLLRDRVAGTTERVSVSSLGEQGNNASYGQSLSGDGRFVAFTSDAGNLVPGDTNGMRDVFLRDRVRGTTERVNLSSAGAQSDNTSDFADVSSNGRFVVFQTPSTNLVPGDTNNRIDIFLRDRVKGTTQRVSVSATGEQANHDNTRPSMSEDARTIVFSSIATNLVPWDTNGQIDVFAVEPAGVPTPQRIAVFRPSTGQWLLRGLDGSSSILTFGVPGDEPVPANFLDDGRSARIAVFRPTTRAWLVRTVLGDTLDPIPFGGAGDRPVPADYLGVGRAQVAVFRPTTHEWFIRTDTGETLGPYQFGGAGDQPVPGSYLGDGRRTQIAVFRPSTRQWFIRSDTGGTIGPIAFGEAGDVPVPADYLGIGRVQIAVYRPATSEWWIRSDIGETMRLPLGAAGDLPYPGDYLGLGHAQPAVFRPTSREWLIRDADGATLRIPWGEPGDQPVPAPYQPWRMGSR
jgi:Tol biopolymer transport system component